MSDMWDNKQANEEGWHLYIVGLSCGIGLCYSSYDKLPGYHPSMKAGEATEQARVFVQQKAREGSAYHIDALARTHLL